jgi:hypothetical protein
LCGTIGVGENMKLQLQKFIEEHENWKELIQQKPYSIETREEGDYILFKYSMIDSDFCLPIVKECRGIILRKDDFLPVCVPFFKFHNVQEQLADNIDWSSAKVQEKIDGSIIKVWFDNGVWNISTNGVIFAINADLQVDYGNVRNYYDLFFSAINFDCNLFKRLNINNTYMFEIVSPLNRVVVPYRETEIYHIGTRDNYTLRELNEDIGIQKPKEFPLSSLEECLSAVEILPFSQEGYVVVDKFWHRVKIKSPAYVAAHHLKNNGVITMKRILDMIRLNGQDDFLAIYPEYTEPIELVETKLSEFIWKVEKDWNEFCDSPIANSSLRKDIAMWITKTNCPSALFCLYDKKVSSAREWIDNQDSEKVLKWIGVKEEWQPL